MESRQQELKDAAAAVQIRFPGPWEECEGMSKGGYRGVRPNIILDAHPEVARYVAAASPDVILDLMQRLADAEGALARYASKGEWAQGDRGTCYVGREVAAKALGRE